MVRRQTLPASPSPPAAKPAKQAKQGRANRPFQLRSQHEALLRALHSYYFLRIEQISQVLGYSPNSYEYVWRLCNDLRTNGYIKPYPFPHTLPVGRPAQVWALEKKGCVHLRELGLEVSTHLRSASEEEYGYLFLKHTLLVNDFFIAASRLSRQMSQVELSEIRHERALKRQPGSVVIRVKAGDGWKDKQKSVVSDGWLDFRVTDQQGKTWRQPLLLELDRGTEDQRAVREKVQALVCFANGPYKQQFETEFVTVAVVTTEGHKRFADLLRWTEAELTEQSLQHEADLFRLCSLPERGDPATLFFAPIWRRPFDTSMAPLLSTEE